MDAPTFSAPRLSPSFHAPIGLAQGGARGQGRQFHMDQPPAEGKGAEYKESESYIVSWQLFCSLIKHCCVLLFTLYDADKGKVSVSREHAYSSFETLE